VPQCPKAGDATGQGLEYLHTCVVIVIFFFSVVFHCFILYVCLHSIVMCALDMLLTKAITYLLTYIFLKAG